MLITIPAIAIAAYLAGEMTARQMGLMDFPLFVRDERAGYRARPSQQGRFMNRHEWTYDANGMRAVGGAGVAGATLLIGDSVVDGGTWTDQHETLAARLQRTTGEAAYPLACRGWALANALAALESLPDWRQAKRLVLVLNRGDFDTIGSMRNRFAFPARHPALALPWLVRKRWRRPAPDPFQSDCRAQNLANFKRLAEEFTGRIAILRYPLKDEPVEPDPYFAELAAEAPGSTPIDLAHSPDWGPDCYDDHIHPNARGIEVMAGFIAQELA